MTALHVEIENDGPNIVASNYWDLPEAGAGEFFLSTNAGVFRLLVPDAGLAYLSDMQAAVEAVVSRGPWPEIGLQDAIEILFDDRTENPFAMQLTPESLDRMPAAADAGRRLILTVWTRGPVKALELPCGFRMVPQIAWTQPRSDPWKEPR